MPPPRPVALRVSTPGAPEMDLHPWRFLRFLARFAWPLADSSRPGAVPGAEPRRRSECATPGEPVGQI